MKYLSVCSGIEAATVAWHHMGWTPVGFSEIEKFPSAVLAHHYPSVPNLGDMTKHQEWNLEPVDLLVGGTPCQSFSVAGLRKGLEDPRGNLMLTFLAIAASRRPRWIVWENVPGVLSSNRGRDFGTFLGALGQLGYGWAYRVLDAQWFGVAQRRRRVFVVGCLGDQRRAAQVLFERESVRRDSPPSREARQAVAGTIAARFGSGRNNHEERVAHLAPAFAPDVANCLETTSHDYSRADGFNMVAQPVGFTRCDHGGDAVVDGTPTMRCGSNYSAHLAVAQPVSFHPTQDPITSEDGSTHCIGTGNRQGTATVAVAYGTDCYNGAITGDVAATLGTPGSSVNASGPTVMQPIATALTASNDPSRSPQSSEVTQQVWAVMQATAQPVGAFKPGQSAAARSIGCERNLSPSLEGDGGGNNKPAVHVAMQVRRLTPVECERLQGFPDGYTNIPWRKQPEAPDGPRYKALGNSMAVPVMRWIGERINEVEKQA